MKKENTSPAAVSTTEVTPGTLTKESIAAKFETLIAGAGKMKADDFVNTLNALKGEVKAYNAALINQRYNDLLVLFLQDPAKMWAEFVNCQFINVLAITGPDAEGKYALGDKRRQLKVGELEKAYQLLKSNSVDVNGNKIADKTATIASVGCWRKLRDAFLHNLALYIKGDIEAADTIARFDSPKLEEVYGKTFAGHSKNALERQLNAVVASIFPEEFPVKMVKADVTALAYAATKEKFMEFSFKKEDAIMASIMLAVYHRVNSLPYKFQSTAKMHKAPNGGTGAVETPAAPAVEEPAPVEAAPAAETAAA